MVLFKVLRWIQVLLSLIVEAEDELGGGAGAAKKARVLSYAEAELNQIGLPGDTPACSTRALLDQGGIIVDAIVAILNCLGVFSKA